MSDWGFIAAAYALSWAALIGYAVYVGARVRRAAHLDSEARRRP